MSKSREEGSQYDSPSAAEIFDAFANADRGATVTFRSGRAETVMVVTRLARSDDGRYWQIEGYYPPTPSISIAFRYDPYRRWGSQYIPSEGTVAEPRREAIAS